MSVAFRSADERIERAPARQKQGQALSGAPKRKFAVYGAASCGGCEVALLNLNERLPEALETLDLVFCPCLMDAKTADVEAMPDGSIDFTLFNGAIRTPENEEMARLLRGKSRVLAACGACASDGGIPALSNLHSLAAHRRDIYGEGPTAAEPGKLPQLVYDAPEGRLELPAFHERVRVLAQIVHVDAVIPGCPPEPDRLWEAILRLASGEPLPAESRVLGAGVSSVCRDCARTRQDKTIGKLRRVFEFIPEPERCLLDQGLACMGIATRDGCGALCPKVNMPCTGCYGPTDGISDQGAKMIAALGSALETGFDPSMSERALRERAHACAGQILDPAGTWYKYTLAGSLLGGRALEDE
jgi:F420-non-reducing hydrogenase small subunit